MVTSDSWYDRAACQGDSPEEWDDSGSGHAFYVCTERCGVRTQCVEAALLEGTKGQMRGGIWFDNDGLLRRPRHLRRVA